MAEIKKTYPIKGMHCASCVRVIERSLSKTPGVKEANVNLATEKATVTYDDSECNPTQLATAVANVGYTAVVDESNIDEEAEKKQKLKELNDLKIKVLFSLGVGVLLLWGSFPGLMETAPAFLKNPWIQL